MNTTQAVAQVVNNPYEISVPQLATLFVTLLSAFDDHGRTLAEEINRQIGSDREDYAEGLAWLEDLIVPGPQ